MPIVFYAAIIAFLVLAVSSIDVSRVAEIRPDWFYTLIAAATGVGFIYWGALVWTVLLRGLGARNARYSTDLIHVYAKSWLGRYIPGTAPWILGKIYFASQFGISKSKLAVSSVLEGGLQIIVLLLISAAMLLADPRLDVVSHEMKLAMVAVMVIGLVCLFPPVFNRLIAVAFRVLRRPAPSSEHHVRGKVVAAGAGLYAVGAVLGGMTQFFVAKAVYPEVSYVDMLFIVGVSNLAGAVSMLAVFTPSGLGVREAILLTLLSTVMPAEYALAATVGARVLTVLIDVGTWTIASVAKMLAIRRRTGHVPT